MIRIVVLGSSAAVPSPQRNTTSVALRYSGEVFLFDCSEGAQRQMMRFGVSYAKVKAIFLTHLHADHILGIPGLMQTLKLIGRKDELLVFGPSGTQRLLEGLLQFEGNEFVRVQDVGRDFEFHSEGFSVHAFQVDHTQNSLGFLFEEKERVKFEKEKADAAGVKGKLFREIEEKGEVTVNGKKVRLEDITFKKKGRKIVFSGDTMPCGSLVEAAAGADILFHDSSFASDMKDEAVAKRHSTAAQAAEQASKAGVKKLVLYHISNRYEDDSVLLEEAKKIFPETVVAKDGMELLV